MVKNKDICTLHLPHSVAAIQAKIAQAAACEPDVQGNILRYPGKGPAVRLAFKPEGDGCTVRISCECTERARRLRTTYLWGSLLLPVAALALCTMEVLPWMACAVVFAALIVCEIVDTVQCSRERKRVRETAAALRRLSDEMTAEAAQTDDAQDAAPST